MSGCYIGAITGNISVGVVYENCIYGRKDVAGIDCYTIAKNCNIGYNCLNFNVLQNCIADNCGIGVLYNNASPALTQLFNFLASNCATGYIVYSWGSSGSVASNNAQYNCTVPISGFLLTTIINVPNQPYEIPGYDYRLNNNFNAGNLLRGAGVQFPNQYTNASIGAVQNWYTVNIKLAAIMENRNDSSY